MSLGKLLFRQLTTSFIPSYIRVYTAAFFKSLTNPLTFFIIYYLSIVYLLDSSLVLQSFCTPSIFKIHSLHFFLTTPSLSLSSFHITYSFSLTSANIVELSLICLLSLLIFHSFSFQLFTLSLYFIHVLNIIFFTSSFTLFIIVLLYVILYSPGYEQQRFLNHVSAIHFSGT